MIFTYFLISLIPTILSLSIIHIYGKSQMTYALLFYAFCITFSQLSLWSLYLYETNVSHQTVEFLFIIFIFGNFMIGPCTIYFYHILIIQTDFKNQSSRMFLLCVKIFNRKSVIFITAWSFLIYLLSISPNGLLINDNLDSISQYMPNDGKWNFLFIIQILICVTINLFSFIVTFNLDNKNFKNLLRIFLGMSSFFTIFFVFISNYIIIFNIYVISYSLISIFLFIKFINYVISKNSHLSMQKKELSINFNINSLLAHQVKNDLSIIVGYSEVLNTLQQQQKKKYKDILDKIHMESLKLNKLIVDHRKFMKYNFNIDYTTFNLEEVISQSIEVAKTKIIAYNFNIDLTRSNNVFINADYTYIFQTFYYLISYIIEKNIYLKDKRKIDIYINLNDDIVNVNIRYQGKVISENEWHDYFYHSQKDMPYPHQLAYCGKIISLHRGLINIIDSNEEYTIIKIELPQYQKNNIKS